VTNVTDPYHFIQSKESKKKKTEIIPPEITPILAQRPKSVDNKVSKDKSMLSLSF